jgi:hypothetical protein
MSISTVSEADAAFGALLIEVSRELAKRDEGNVLLVQRSSPALESIRIPNGNVMVLWDADELTLSVWYSLVQVHPAEDIYALADDVLDLLRRIAERRGFRVEFDDIDELTLHIPTGG